MTSIEPYKNRDLPDRFLRWIELLIIKLRGVPEEIVGEGSPEGVVSARRRTRYYNRTGSAGTLLYVKTTETGNTGWVAYG
jgi:hypothetical protein